MNESYMEPEIDLPNFPDICRICLESEALQLFSEDYLLDVFKTITSIEVEYDGFPLYICKDCFQKLEEITDFGDMARYNNIVYQKTWMRTKLIEDAILNEQKHAALANNHSRMIDEALSNNHRRMKDALPYNHSKMATVTALSNTYSEKKHDEVLLDTDSDMTNDAVVSKCHIEPKIKAELLSIDSEIIKEEVFLDTDSDMTNNSALSSSHSEPTVKVEPSNTCSEKINEVALVNAHKLMTIPLPNNQGDAIVKVELSNISSKSTSEAVFSKAHSDVIMNRQGEKAQAATFFGSLNDSTCSSNSMDQNSGVVTITDSESEPESRDVSFISGLQIGNVGDDPGRHQNPDTSQNPDMSQNPDKPRKTRHRHVYKRYEILELEKEFVIDPFPTSNRREKIAVSLGISPVQVKVWFQNRRMKNRKEDEKMKRNRHEEWKKKMIMESLRQMEPQKFNPF